MCPSKYPNTFVVIDKSNGNYGSCINAALKVATGRYFRICDADDKYQSENLPGYLTMLRESCSDLVFSPFKILNYDSTIWSTIGPATPFLSKVRKIGDIDWSKDGLIKYRAMHAMCVRTQILTNNHYFQTEGISYTDVQFVFYSFLYSETCSFTELYIYEYFLGRDGQTMSPEAQKRSYMHFYKNAERMLKDYIALPVTIAEEKRKVLFRSVMSVIRPYASIILHQIKDIRKEEELLNALFELSTESALPCPVEKELMKDRNYKLWKRFHVPHLLFYAIYHK